MDRGSFRDDELPGGFDGFFNALMTLNEKGRAAQAAFNPLSDENPEASCVGRPTPAALLSTSLYLMEMEIRESEEIVSIRSEYFDEERTVYMDGREHPGPAERFGTGHSIGWWEGDTLVVDTRNFEDHRSPYQIGVPSAVKSMWWSDTASTRTVPTSTSNSRLRTPNTWQSRWYIAGSLNYSPHMEMFPGACDPEATRRFIEP